MCDILAATIFLEKWDNSLKAPSGLDLSIRLPNSKIIKCSLLCEESTKVSTVLLLISSLQKLFLWYYGRCCMKLFLGLEELIHPSPYTLSDHGGI